MPNLIAQDIMRLNWVYDQALAPLWQQIGHAPQTSNLTLATQLLQYAKLYSMHEAFTMIDKPNQAIKRDTNNPQFFEHPHIKNQLWADNTTQPLEKGESWNQGRRRTNINLAYNCNTQGLPINPYLNFGLVGRGGLGRYGPNHAVDCGILRVLPNAAGQQTLHALGIIRQDDGKKALCGGYTTFSQSLDGDYPYTKKDIEQSQSHEFFEELVSGSIELLPNYTNNLDDIINKKITLREIIEEKKFTTNQKLVLSHQIETELKVKQIEATDGQFLGHIQTAFEQAMPCFAGPVLSSSRNTNNAWMETYLSWFELDDNTWQTWQQNSPYAYNFKAGDDAEQVMWHELNSTLIEQATPSHGTFFGFLLAAYITKKTSQGQVVPEIIQNQAKDMLKTFNQPQIWPHFD